MVSAARLKCALIVHTLTQRERRQNDEDGNKHAHAGISIESASMGCSEPDSETRCHDAQIIDCIADNVDHHSHHA
jgi:hypothetical protein